MAILEKHKVLEKNATLLLVFSFLVVTIGGIVEIAPLFYLENTIEKVDGMRPYSPLELAGRDIYVREGCYVCHSQMIRPMQAEYVRYGEASRAEEFIYDFPFQWGSKRTGPDLARVGGRYSDAWHVAHFHNPRDLVPESVMPAYSWFATTPVNAEGIADSMRVQRIMGVPYTDEMIDSVAADFRTQANPDAGDVEALEARYPKAVARNFDGQAGITELDAVIAYLQMLGTLVDFSTYTPAPSR